MNTSFNLKIIIIVLELIFEWSRRFANDTFSISNFTARFQYIHFSVQNKFYAIHTTFLPALLNSTSVRLRYSNLTWEKSKKIMIAGKPRENNLISELVLFCFDSLSIHSSILKILCGKAETNNKYPDIC